MIQSMTGFGKAEYVFGDHKTIVEIRSLNSKQLDMTLKAAPLFREKEWEIRGMLAEKIERGKVDVTITSERTNELMNAGVAKINREAAKYYFREMAAIMDEMDAEEVQGRDAMILQAVMRMPEVVQVAAEATELSAQEWTLLQNAIGEALYGFTAFRKQEGAALEAMFTEKLDGISALLGEVEPLEKGRVEKIKQRLMGNLEQLAEETKQAVDKNRLEAELIYYLEKLDITEEKVRLRNHIKYFREVMGDGLQVTGDGLRVTGGVGKKLGFVAQEMGREINTLGSKSNQSEMQIIVVKMKDILEQIKEQVLNVL